MIKVDPKLLNFFQMVNELKNKKSELAWKSDKLIHKKDEDNSEIIEQLKEEISQLEFGVIPHYIKSNAEDFKIFFSDGFINQYTIDIHKDYVRPHYGLQGIGEDNEYDSYQYWKECAAYYNNLKNEYFKVAVGFFKDLEAIYEWKSFGLLQ
jgi:hypothetical protein